MIRDCQKLQSELFDVVVIGGGVNGAAAAWDASLRGLRVALVEKDDFGAHTSAGCFKIIHGGLRYLQHFDLPRLFDSVREQRLTRLIAPHLLEPLPFLIPCYKPLMKRRFTLRLAMTVYELLAWNRNVGVQRSLVLPSHRVLSREECLRIAPGLQQEGLEGGVIYYDVQMSNADRLTFGLVQAAAAAGAVVANYCRVTSLESTETPGELPAVTAVRIEDGLDGGSFSIRTRAVINAAGPWIAGLGNQTKTPEAFSKGIQFVVPKIISECAVAVESRNSDPAAKVARGARAYFLQPWNGVTLVGTSDELVKECPDDFAITTRDVERFVSELRGCYATESLEADSVLHAFGGLRPVADDIDLSSNQGDEAKAARKDLVVDHAREPLSGKCYKNVISMRGVKYTTFRSFAEKSVNVLTQKMGRPLPGCTASARFPSTPSFSLEEYQNELERQFPSLDAGYLKHLLKNFGTDATAIAQLAQSGMQRTLGANLPISEAEVRYCCRNEMVHSLDDLLTRRLPVVQMGVPSASVLRAFAEIAASELGWDEQRMQREVAVVERRRILPLEPGLRNRKSNCSV